jgi:hypothetical protein
MEHKHLNTAYLKLIADHRTPHNQRAALIATASVEQFKPILELIENFLAKYFEVTTKLLNSLRKHKKLLVKLTSRHLSNDAKRRLIVKNYKVLLLLLRVVTPWLHNEVFK